MQYSTDIPIHLREMFPPELIGAMVRGSFGRPTGESEISVGYTLYVSNNEGERNFLGDVDDKKSYGARVEVRLPTSGSLRTLNFAADYFNGYTTIEGGSEIFSNEVWGAEQQLVFGQFGLNSEYARGKWRDGETRFGYYTQPSVRMTDEWIGFYRLEGLESARVQEAERRHLAGVNYKPLPEISLKFEYYYATPLKRDFIPESAEMSPYSGVAAAAALFF